MLRKSGSSISLASLASSPSASSPNTSMEDSYLDHDDKPVSSSAPFLGRSHHPQRRVSTLYLLLLTSSSFGVQIVWSIIMSQGTPYLHSLGFSSALTAIVWLAGPLSGAIVQPIVGAHSDRCTSRFGRRKPYIVGGAIATSICMLALASVHETVCILSEWFGIGDSAWWQTWVKLAAVFWVYVLNIAIQPLQAGTRAFVVDNCPPSQQAEASAWVSRFSSFGSVFAFLLGSVKLPRWMGDTQFMALTIVMAVVLAVVVPLSFLLVLEEGRSVGKAVQASKKSSGAVFWSLIRTVKFMPPRTRLVCRVQFFAWLGWFPFLYYNTMYVGTLARSSVSASTLAYPISSSKQALLDTTARTGAFASFLFAVVSLSSTLVLPSLANSHPFFSISRLWRASHILFSITMLLTFFAHTVLAGTALVALLGTSWALTLWAPYAIISEEITALAEEEGSSQDRSDAGVKVGSVMGLHNVAIAAPQVLAALMCSGVFKVLGSLGVEDVLGWVLRVAGVAMLGAAWVGRKL